MSHAKGVARGAGGAAAPDTHVSAPPLRGTGGAAAPAGFPPKNMKN